MDARQKGDYACSSLEVVCKRRREGKEIRGKWKVERATHLRLSLEALPGES